MKLEVVMKKVGMDLVEADTEGGVLTLSFRVATDDQTVARWRSAIGDLLGPAGAKHARKGKWDIDISQAYFVRAGRVLYLWRAIIKGKRKAGAEAFGHALQRSMSHGVELESAPLVGQISYKLDPANGKIKGGHSPAQAPGIISAAAGGR